MGYSAIKQTTIQAIIRDRMAESGIDNYAFVDGHLLIGSARYAVDACGCGHSDCDGLRLRPIQPTISFPSQIVSRDTGA
ncbi:MAG: hypothetical protein JWQ16_2808 [Novosphingobium sp.]|nr:hypothetical protein [Novosphingobium sp.]